MKTVPAYHGDKAALVNRIKRIEGQVRGIERMVEGDTYCIDVITQIAAVTKALQGLAVVMLEDHVQHCMAQAADGPAETRERMVQETTDVIKRILRT
jgi:DNA-binding FrmR family transcriptional regulator